MKQVKIISGFLIAFLFSGMLAQAADLPIYGVMGGIAVLSAFAHKPTLVALTAIDITELVAALGDYYRENRDLLFSEMLLDPDVTSMFNVYDNVIDELPMPNLEIGNIIKPGIDPTFSPTSNAISIGARILKVRDVKFDLLIVPKLLHKNWLAYSLRSRRGDGSRDIYEIPFEQFIMDYISKSARNQLYMQAMFKGSYNAAGTAPVATMTGFATLVTQLIAAEVAVAGSGIVPVTMADVTAANVITSVETLHDALGDAYKGMPTEMKVEPQIFDWYNRRYRLDFGANNDYGGMTRARRTIDGTMCDLVREPGLTGTGRMICSPKENFAYGCDTTGTATLEIQKFDRQIKILGDFKAGVQFQQIHDRGLVVNELVSDAIA